LAAESALEGYGAVAMAIKRYQNKLARDAGEVDLMNNIIEIIQMLNAC
jgi:hypothetical protein